jgi:hypothetical protein
MIDYIFLNDIKYIFEDDDIDKYYKVYNIINSTYEKREILYFNNKLKFTYIDLENYIRNLNFNKYQEFSTKNLKLIIEKRKNKIINEILEYNIDYIYNKLDKIGSNDITEYINVDNFNLLTDIQIRNVYKTDYCRLYSVKFDVNSVLELYIDVYFNDNSGVRLKKTITDENNNIILEVGPSNFGGLYGKIATFNGSIWTNITPENYNLTPNNVKKYEISLKIDGFTSKKYTFNIKNCHFFDKIALKWKNRFNIYEYYTFNIINDNYLLNDISYTDKFYYQKNTTNSQNILKISSNFIDKTEEKLIKNFMESEFCIDYINNFEYIINNSEIDSISTINLNNFLFELKTNQQYE